MAYSKDYRQMILDKLDEGYSYRELAEEYQISTTTIQRWKKNIERKAYVYTVYKVDSDRLKADVELYPDAYQIERARRLNCSLRQACLISFVCSLLNMPSYQCILFMGL